MKNLSRPAFIVLACLILLSQSGCWSSVELNDRAFARLMLLDRAGSGIRLTLGFPLPNRVSSGKAGSGGGGESSQPFSYVTKTGASIGEAYRAIQTDLSRKITFGQLRTVVFGREFAEAGVKPIVDVLARMPTIHINGNLFVAEGEALQVVKMPVVFERFPVVILNSYVRDHNTLGVTIKDLLASIYDGGDIVIPMIVFGREGAVSEKDRQNWTGTDGAAIFRQGRMAGTLNTMETRGAMWIMGDLKDAEFDIASPADGKSVSFLIENARSKVRPVIEKDRISFRIACKGDARVISTESDIDVTNLEQKKALERKLDEALERRIEMAIDKTRQAGSDAFQFGDYLKWRYPRVWQRVRSDWRARFAREVNVNTQVNITINRFGSARKPDWNRFITEKGET